MYEGACLRRHPPWSVVSQRTFDLRTLRLETPKGEWYIAIPEGTIDDPMVLMLQTTPLAESDHLPGEDYFLGPEEPPVEAEIKRVLECGKVVALTSQVEHVNRNAGQWSLLTEHGMKTGKTTSRGPSLEVWPESHWPGFALLQADVLQSYTA